MSFLPADDTAVGTPSKQINGAHHLDEPSSYGSPESATSQRQSGVGAVGSVSKPESKPEGAKDLGQIRDSATNPAPSNQSAIGAAVSSVSNAVPTSSGDVKSQLAEAKATITRLRQQVEEQGLRQRKSDGAQGSKENTAAGTTGQGIQRVHASGVPVQIVAGLCLLSFLLAYFFF